jgi:hypothetical protein
MASGARSTAAARTRTRRPRRMAARSPRRIMARTVCSWRRSRRAVSGTVRSRGASGRDRDGIRVEQGKMGATPESVFPETLSSDPETATNAERGDVRLAVSDPGSTRTRVALPGSPYTMVLTYPLKSRHFGRRHPLAVAPGADWAREGPDPSARTTAGWRSGSTGASSCLLPRRKRADPSVTAASSVAGAVAAQRVVRGRSS